MEIFKILKIKELWLIILGCVAVIVIPIGVVSLYLAPFVPPISRPFILIGFFLTWAFVAEYRTPKTDKEKKQGQQLAESSPTEE